MKKLLLVVVFGGIVLGLVLTIWRQPPPGKVSELEKSQPDIIEARLDVERSVSDSLPVPEPIIAEPKEKSNAAPISIEPPVFHSPIDDRPGVYKKLQSPEFATYLILTSAGAVGEGESLSADPVTRNRASDNIRRKYDLSDEELAALVEYSSFVVRSDRQYQGEEVKNICDARASYQNLTEFGNALNAFKNKTVAHQEMLGRQAESKLPPLAFQKLNQAILNRPPKERTVADFSVLLVNDNRTLGQEIARFCDPQPEVLQD